MDEAVAELPDEELFDEISRLVDYQDWEIISHKQETWLSCLRDELLKRASVGGPHADYTGPDDAE